MEDIVIVVPPINVWFIIGRDLIVVLPIIVILIVGREVIVDNPLAVDDCVDSILCLFCVSISAVYCVVFPMIFFVTTGIAVLTKDEDIFVFLIVGEVIILDGNCVALYFVRNIDEDNFDVK